MAKYPNGTEEIIKNYTFSPARQLYSSDSNIKIEYKGKTVYQSISVRNNFVTIHFYFQNDDKSGYDTDDAYTVNKGQTLYNALNDITAFEPFWIQDINPLNGENAYYLKTFLSYQDDELLTTCGYYTLELTSGSCTGWGYFYRVHPIENDEDTWIIPTDNDYPGWSLTMNAYEIGTLNEDSVDIIYAYQKLEWTPDTITRTIIGAQLD